MKKGCIIFLIVNVLISLLTIIYAILEPTTESNRQDTTKHLSASKDSLPNSSLSHLKEEMHFVTQEKQNAKLTADVVYYLGVKGQTLSKDTEVVAICQTDEEYTLLEDKDGNRFTVLSRYVKTQRPLKMINPNYHYYMGGTWFGTFAPYKHSISEVVSKWGDYTLCNKQENSYTFPYITYVSGISRSHSVTLYTDEKGIVISSIHHNETSNLFGFLFFYSDILSLNIYEPQGPLLIEPGTDNDNSTSITEGILTYILYMLPLSIVLLAILWGMMFIRFVPNKAINFTLRTGTFLIPYFFSIIFLEHYHSVWMILFPCYLGIGYALALGLKSCLRLEKRCKRCHTIYSINFYKEETGREATTINCNIHFTLDTNRKITHSAYTYYATTVHYHHKDVCKKCQYTQEYNSNAILKRAIEECPHCGNKNISKNMNIDNAKYREGKVIFDYAYKEYCPKCGELIWEGKGTYQLTTSQPSQSHPQKRTDSSSNTNSAPRDNSFRHGYECRYFNSGLTSQMGSGICTRTGCDQNGSKCNISTGYCPYFESR
ncbi:hypothetical protein [Bacteroides congonensis]|uniref:hypothetical protein n=1 Tax=Bacteroides congonensis TaxID=1871006 RepID=UPI000934C017|nr:hypothetical protein [Bacteroides congonensis]